MNTRIIDKWIAFSHTTYALSSWRGDFACFGNWCQPSIYLYTVLVYVNAIRMRTENRRVKQSMTHRRTSKQRRRNVGGKPHLSGTPLQNSNSKRQMRQLVSARTCYGRGGRAASTRFRFSRAFPEDVFRSIDANTISSRRWERDRYESAARARNSNARAHKGGARSER